MWQNGHYIFKKHNLLSCHSVPNGVKNYFDFCKIFGLKQLIESPSRITITSGYEKALVEINLPEYKKFDNVNVAYSNLIQKLMEVIDKVAPVKSKRIQKNSQKWFDSEI